MTFRDFCECMSGVAISSFFMGLYRWYKRILIPKRPYIKSGLYKKDRVIKKRLFSKITPNDLQNVE